MGIVGGKLGYYLLRRLGGDGSKPTMDGGVYQDQSKLDALLGEDLWQDVRGKTVVDFGCGEGHEAVEIARRGAARVIGVDIRQNVLEKAQALAVREGVAEACTFTTQCDEPADLIVSLDSFEHFEDPGAILQVMAGMLKPGGRVWTSFGPTWRHPLGGHLFSVFPWSHLIFTEQALIRWRADFKQDGATRFGEVEGGLNQMTIARFERLVEQSPFDIETMRLVPIRAARHFWNAWTREFLTSMVQCKLVLRRPQPAPVLPEETGKLAADPVTAPVDSP